MHLLSLSLQKLLQWKLNSKVIKGHFRVKFEIIFKKSLTNQGEGARIILQA